MSDISDFTERRQFERYPLMLDALISLPKEHYDAVLIDISAGGAKFQFREMPPMMPGPGIPISITIQPFGGFYGSLMWVDDDFAGMKFEENHKAMASLIHEMVAQSRSDRAVPE
ncbi:MAG: PilZ domain-containing protein [Alphaproteobacteria bacterium]|nr:PilZ domain-containing protein [Alphaproteobacteria bacterium]